MGLIAMIGDKQLNVEIEKFIGKKNEEVFRIKIDEKVYNVDVGMIGIPNHFSMIVDQKSYDVDVTQDDDEFVVTVKGNTYLVQIEDESKKKLIEHDKDKHHAGEVMIKAPMPGMVVGVEIKEGDEVGVGKGLVILEAMKMQNELRAPKSGLVKTIKVKAGDKVNSGDVLVVLQ